MSFKEFIIKLANLCMFTDKETNEWQSDKQMVRAAYLLFFSIMIMLFLFFITSKTNAYNSKVFSLLYRLSRVAGISIVLISLINLSLHYYHIFLRNGRNLYLTNILTLYIMAVFLFGYLYFWIYTIAPHRFNYQCAIFVPNPIIEYAGVNTLKTNLDFLIYSARNMLAMSYWKISANSTVTSIIEIIQRLYGLFLIVVCFSTFVTKERHFKIYPK